MVNVDTLKRQHEDVVDIVAGITGLIKKDNIEQDAFDIANKISMLAGKLKIHLNTEDEYMYPSLLNSENTDLRSMAKQYIDEMGEIGKVFVAYKESYNTKTKILKDKDGFKKATEDIVKLLTERIEKENSKLYPLL